MNIELHIERLVLDGLPVGAGQGAAIQAAVEAELARLLASGELSPVLLAGGAVPMLHAGGIQVAGAVQPGPLGTQIAGAVHGAMGGTKT
jgi:hypothetical protein